MRFKLGATFGPMTHELMTAPNVDRSKHLVLAYTRYPEQG